MSESIDRLYWVLMKSGSPFALFGVSPSQTGPFADEESARKIADALDGIVVGVDVTYLAEARHDPT